MEEKKSQFEPVQWSAREFLHRDKSFLWHITTGVIAVILVVVSVLGRNYFFSLFVVLAWIVLTFMSRREPREINFSITEKGVGIGEDDFYPFDSLEHFSFREREGGMREFILRKKGIFNPHVHILADSDVAESVRRALAEKLEEEKYEESLMDVLIDWFGF